MRSAAAAGLLIALCAVAPAAAQSYRQEMKVPPIEVFQSMLGFAERGELAKVAASLPILAPIIDHIEHKFKVGLTEKIRAAVAAGNRDLVLATVEDLVIFDMKDLLDQALQNLATSADAARTPIKTARFNYELLAPVVAARSPEADRAIKRAFAALFETLNASGAGPELGRNLGRNLTVIVFELAKVFPQKTGEDAHGRARVGWRA
jgi:hypothetical protein